MKTLKLILLACCLSLSAAYSQEAPVSDSILGLGFSAGIGTDINLGLALGGGASFAFPADDKTWFESGIDFYYYHGIETSRDGPFNYVYQDTTTLLVYALTFNTLFNYSPGATGLFFIAGVGFGAFNVDWIKYSASDPSYNDSGNETIAGLLVNPGIGITLPLGFEIKLRLPVLMVFREYAGTLIAPMLVLSAGMRL